MSDDNYTISQVTTEIMANNIGKRIVFEASVYN